MDWSEIPLRGVPERFGVTLPDDLTLLVTVAWRNRGGAGWVLDLATADGVRLVCGLPLVTGADLLAQHKHLGIPGALIILTEAGDPDEVPAFANLGSDARLYYVTGIGA